MEVELETTSLSAEHESIGSTFQNKSPEKINFEN